MLEKLLDAVEAVITSWQFYPVDEYGTPEALADTAALIRLEAAYRDYTEAAE